MIPVASAPRPAPGQRTDGETPEQGFDPRWRLRRRKEYLRVQGQGRKLVSEHFLSFAAANGRDHVRIGITASRKVGNAVVRNRVKRLVREVFRRHKADFPAGVDVVFIARRSAAAVTFVQVKRELSGFGRRLKRRLRRREERRA